MSVIMSSEQANAPAQVGGKAAALHRLKAAGFAPPDFFVITNTAFAHTQEGLQISQAFDAELEAALAELGPGPYAVRSSAQSEDGAEHSHAGQFDTVLNVAHADVAKAAQQVWQSGFSQTVETYRALKTGGAAEAPAIIVQRMIVAQASGVAFSADPVSGQRNHVVISAISGLGERLVSGEADGEDWLLDEANAPIQAPADPACLTAEQAASIADLALRAEAEFGCPQDIEWAIDAAGLHILQARPITTALKPAPILDPTLTIFDNSNIVESYPGLVSPLTYSFATHVYARVYRAFVHMLGVSDERIAQNPSVFDNLLGRVDGRVYYNLINWYRALAMLPGFSLNRDYMETMMGVSEPMPREITDQLAPPPATGWRMGWEYAKMGKAGAGLGWQALRLGATRRKFYARLNAVLESGLNTEEAHANALAAEYRRIESTLLDRWDAPLINDFLCMIAFGASRNLLQNWLGDAGVQLHNDVMIGQGDIISAQPARRIAEMGQIAKEAGMADALKADPRLETLAQSPALAQAVAAYMEKFSDRCTEELKLESLTLEDDPTPLLQAIAFSAERGEAPVHHAEEPDWQALFPSNPVRRRVAKWAVSWSKARVRDRENLRFERTRIFGYARRVFLGIGRELAAHGHLEDARDVFYLTKDEVLGAVEGAGLSGNLKALVALRKEEAAQAALRPDPPERIARRGPALVRATQEATPAKQNSGALQRGIGCSAGQITARARVIRDPRSEALEPGEVLVARHTDPGWIAVFSNASAIVVERGSLLSHSAIVARELGIPCVVGLKGATHWIESGEQIRVDGGTGEVERIDDHE